MEEESPSPAPSSPDLEGYNSSLEEVNTTAKDVSDADSDDNNITIRSPSKGLSLIGVNPGPARSRASTGSLPPRDRRGRFTRQRGSIQSASSEGAENMKGRMPSWGKQRVLFWAQFVFEGKRPC